MVKTVRIEANKHSKKVCVIVDDGEQQLINLDCVSIIRFPNDIKICMWSERHDFIGHISVGKEGLSIGTANLEVSNDPPREEIIRYKG